MVIVDYREVEVEEGFKIHCMYMCVCMYTFICVYMYWQYTVYSIQCPVYSVQYTVYTVQ